MKKWAVVDLTACSVESLSALQKYMPLFEEIGRLWRTELVVDYRGEKSDFEKTDATRRVFVHIAKSPPQAYFSSKSISSIFGYKFINGPVTRLEFTPHYDNARGIFITTPEANRVVQIKDGHIYIVVDLIANPTANNAEVLRILMNLSLAKIFGNTRAHPSIQKRMERIYGVLRKKMLSQESHMVGMIGRFILLEMEKSVQEAKGHIKEMEGARKEALEIAVDLRRKIFEAMKFIQLRVPPKTREQYAEIFEELLRIEGVAKVDTDQEKLTITTEPLKQYVTSNQKSYEIGSFEIKIDPRSFSRKGIEAKQVLPGKFIHPHMLNRVQDAICFGTANQVEQNGFNEAVDKLMENFDVLNLVHLLISFLRFDDQQPAANTHKGIALPIEATAQRYPSDNERRMAKERFVAFMDETEKSIRGRMIKENLEELLKKESEENERYWRTVREKKEWLRFCDWLEAQKKEVFGLATTQFKKLVKNKFVAYLDYQDGLRVFVWDEKEQCLLVIWFGPAKLPWLISPFAQKDTGPNYTLQIDDHIRMKKLRNALSRLDYAKVVSRLCGYCLVKQPKGDSQ